ncbi:hypothetical protein BURMUCGD1_5398 [Burkholderia multivorans CGD1]|nr:hypothetical protein BURMUCGD1_5398 [Burkholderia multivorans CGD1]
MRNELKESVFSFRHGQKRTARFIRANQSYVSNNRIRAKRVN